MQPAWSGGLWQACSFPHARPLRDGTGNAASVLRGTQHRGQPHPWATHRCIPGTRTRRCRALQSRCTRPCCWHRGRRQKLAGGRMEGSVAAWGVIAQHRCRLLLWACSEYRLSAHGATFLLLQQQLRPTTLQSSGDHDPNTPNVYAWCSGQTTPCCCWLGDCSCCHSCFSAGTPGPPARGEPGLSSRPERLTAADAAGVTGSALRVVSLSLRVPQ